VIGKVVVVVVVVFGSQMSLLTSYVATLERTNISGGKVEVTLTQ
jgi:hypothetical protein